MTQPRTRLNRIVPTTTSRRSVLRASAALGAMSVLGVPALSGRASASGHAVETLYLSNSLPDGTTDLFTVDLDSVAGAAVLTPVTTVSGSFSNVDAIAATPDGETVVLVDRNSKHLGVYDVDADAFVDKGQIAGLPTITVLAAYGLDGTLYAASNTTNELYTIDATTTPPVATSVGTIVGATVNGADIVFDSNGTLFMHSNADDTLYTLDYQNPSGGLVQATTVGTDAGASLTGLAVRGAGQGDLVGSSRADNAIVVIDKASGSRTDQFAMTLNGSAYSYLNGDMTVGVLVDDTCVDCVTVDGVKYEFACVETDPVTSECVAWDFVPEDDTDSGITYDAGSFTSKDDEAFEPMDVTFDTEYCTLYAVVKSGKAIGVQELTAKDGQVTVDSVSAKRAISFVEFHCSTDAAQAAADSHSSNNGKGR